MNSLFTQSGAALHSGLVLLSQKRHANEATNGEQRVHVAGAGATLTAAYEQFRNAADNTEEHLLLQNSIRRFYRQVAPRGGRGFKGITNELIIELTHAGYLPNDSVSIATVQKIDELAATYGDLYDKVSLGSNGHDALRWVLDCLSVDIERELSDHAADDVFLQFSHDYFREAIDADKVFPDDKPDEYDIALFMAVHKALLKSDTAVVRADLIRRYDISFDGYDPFSHICQRIDKLIASREVDKLYRIINRHAAPQRVLRRMVNDTPNVAELMERPDVFARAYESQIGIEYGKISDRLQKAITRSIIFLFVSKVVVGVAFEVPYDLLVYGTILWVPLIINLLFPPMYMALLGMTLMVPGSANTKALVERMKQIMYRNDRTVLLQPTAMMKPRSGNAFNIAYAIFVVALFLLVGWGLTVIGFTFIHILIFFIFLSTASFLGFRLSHMVRELEVVETNQNGLTFARDLFYIPFASVGRWLSEKYARVNIVTTVLDMVIELPLKTTLRLIRQWTSFINAKKDDI